LLLRDLHVLMCHSLKGDGIINSSLICHLWPLWQLRRLEENIWSWFEKVIEEWPISDNNFPCTNDLKNRNFAYRSFWQRNLYYLHFIMNPLLDTFIMTLSEREYHAVMIASQPIISSRSTKSKCLQRVNKKLFNE
jgi:hypothetical protein